MAGANVDTLCRIGDRAARTGVNPRLLRHVENQGVLSAERSSTGQRLFAHDAVEQVRHIRELLASGLPLRVVGELLDCIHEPGRVEPCAVPLLVDHLKSYDARIAILLTTRASLRGLIEASQA